MCLSSPNSFSPSSVFTKDELILALRPVYNAIYNQDPESFPFRIPVDPKALGIPVSTRGGSEGLKGDGLIWGGGGMLTGVCTILYMLMFPFHSTSGLL